LAINLVFNVGLQYVKTELSLSSCQKMVYGETMVTQQTDYAPRGQSWRQKSQKNTWRICEILFFDLVRIFTFDEYLSSAYFETEFIIPSEVF